MYENFNIKYFSSSLRKLPFSTFQDLLNTYPCKKNCWLMLTFVTWLGSQLFLLPPLLSFICIFSSTRSFSLSHPHLSLALYFSLFSTQLTKKLLDSPLLTLFYVKFLCKQYICAGNFGLLSAFILCFFLFFVFFFDSIWSVIIFSNNVKIIRKPLIFQTKQWD